MSEPTLSTRLVDEPVRSNGFSSLGLWASIAATLAGNIASALAYKWGWIGTAELFWTYWLQSVSIGLFNMLRIATLHRFDVTGFTSNGKPVEETPAAKRSTALFFLFHYGFFHVVYAVFLSGDRLPWSDRRMVVWLLLNAAFFVVGELINYLRVHRADRTGRPNIGVLMFRPYLRIIPMHLSIIFAGVAPRAIWVFLPLKIVCDIGMLLVDAGIERRSMAHAQTSVA
ncbi:MAG: DUF6498-containing protein [Tepidisphaeraceae bacterium]